MKFSLFSAQQLSSVSAWSLASILRALLHPTDMALLSGPAFSAGLIWSYRPLCSGLLLQGGSHSLLTAPPLQDVILLLFPQLRVDKK